MIAAPKKLYGLVVVCLMLANCDQPAPRPTAPRQDYTSSEQIPLPPAGTATPLSVDRWAESLSNCKDAAWTFESGLHEMYLTKGDGTRCVYRIGYSGIVDSTGGSAVCYGEGGPDDVGIIFYPKGNDRLAIAFNRNDRASEWVDLVKCPAVRAR